MFDARNTAGGAQAAKSIRGGRRMEAPFVLRLANTAVLLAALSASCWAQSESPKEATYILEPTTMTSITYPLQAREQKIQGRAAALMLVSETGDVETVQTFLGHEVLAHAAEEAIRQWKFKPVTKDGKTIPVIAKVTFDFVMSSDNVAANTISPEISPATDFPPQVRVTVRVLQESLLTKVDPVYPRAAAAQHIRGTVTLSVVIGKDGTIGDVQFISGPAELAPAAIEAVKQWHFRAPPYRLLGRAVAVQTNVQFNFR